MNPHRRTIIKGSAAVLTGAIAPKLVSAQSTPALATFADTLVPYLQNPSPTGMSVCFLARAATEVTVAWTVEEGKGLTHTEAIPLPIPGTPWTRWTARLTGLAPGTTYRYQVEHKTGDSPSPAKSEIYPFTTPDTGASETSFIVFNDIHDNHATIAALMENVKPAEFDYSIFNGDMINDPSSADGARKVFELWNYYVDLLDGSSKPIYFVRGNHEVRGGFRDKLHHLFDLPDLKPGQKPADQQWQYEFTAGPVHFITLDTGEDDGPETAEDSYKRPKFWQDYRKREARWLAERVDAGNRPSSPWRIFVGHIPLHNPAGWFSISSRDGWLPHLRRWKPTLMLAGHDHAWKFLPANKTFSVRGNEGVTDTPEFPVLIGGGPSMKEGTVILVQANSETLNARMLSTKGKLLHEFNA